MEETPKFRGVPTYFRIGCLEAKQGGSNMYSTPAWHLAIHTEENMPHDCDDDEVWETMLDELREAAGSENIDGVWEWYRRVFPKCMELVPAKRKEQFAEGVIKAWEDGRL